MSTISIKAIQWSGDNSKDIYDLIGKRYAENENFEAFKERNELFIQYKMRPMKIGDWIIQDNLNQRRILTDAEYQHLTN